ncbi:MAG TPA: hypothetical protein PKM21_15330 [Anaerolineales bacterium]|nr:hypothetical protein [Anaerolineales bacterium]
MSKISPFPATARLALHYYPDTEHYREQDLLTWLPELTRLGITWLTLLAPAGRAIPEAFIMGLLSAGIQPVLHFRPVNHLLVGSSQEMLAELGLMFETYARWGVRHALLFDRPNLRQSWPPPLWAQKHLVERFLDRFLPLAEAACQAGLQPVFPPLQPGGDYWDTAFLRAALQGLERRATPTLLDKLALGAYALVDEHPLDWGAGGPERWPKARPYSLVDGSSADHQDQRGFRIYDWYLALSRAVLGAPRSILLAIQSQVSTTPSLPNRQAQETHAQIISDIVLRMAATPGADEHVPAQVLSCSLGLLTTAPNHPHAAQAWFPPNQEPKPCVFALRQQISGLNDQSGINLATLKQVQI